MMPVLKQLLLGLIISGSITVPAVAADSLRQGVELYNKRDYKSALPYFAKATENDSSRVTAFYYEALCHTQLGNKEKALYFYNAVVKLFPNSDEARLANTYINRLKPANSAFSSNASVDHAPVVATFSQTQETGAPQFSAFSANASDQELRLLPDETSVPFTRALDGHLYVNAEVNGRTMKVCFDTGASTCLFEKKQLQAAGVNVILGPEKIAIGGVGSNSISASPMMVNLKLGRIERRMPIMVQDAFSGPQLLGQTFYNGYRYEIDNQNGLMRFVKKTSAKAAVPYDAIEVPFVVEGNNLVVNAQINGSTCPMYFDTGASGVVFDYMTFAQLGIPIPSNVRFGTSGGIGGSAHGFMMEVESIKLGSLTKNNVPITVLQSGGPPRPLLGQTFYSDRKYVIDNDKHVIKFFR